MKKVFKVVGLLVLGAVLGQAFLFGLGLLLLNHKIRDPHFLMLASLPSNAPDAMSNDELADWNKMRDEIRARRFADVDKLTRITKDDVDFEVLPAKTVFASNETVLAALYLKNVSDHTLHVNEPRVRQLTFDKLYYQGSNQLDYEVSISCLESSWMRTLYPGQDLSIPLIIPVRNKGPYMVNYSLDAGGFNGQSGEDITTIDQTNCNFTVQ
jgi:hypothetical protein